MTGNKIFEVLSQLPQSYIWNGKDIASLLDEEASLLVKYKDNTQLVNRLISLFTEWGKAIAENAQDDANKRKELTEERRAAAIAWAEDDGRSLEASAELTSAIIGYANQNLPEKKCLKITSKDIKNIKGTRGNRNPYLYIKLLNMGNEELSEEVRKLLSKFELTEKELKALERIVNYDSELAINLCKKVCQTEQVWKIITIGHIIEESNYINEVNFYNGVKKKAIRQAVDVVINQEGKDNKISNNGEDTLRRLIYLMLCHIQGKNASDAESTINEYVQLVDYLCNCHEEVVRKLEDALPKIEHELEWSINQIIGVNDSIRATGIIDIYIKIKKSLTGLERSDQHKMLEDYADVIKKAPNNNTAELIISIISASITPSFKKSNTVNIKVLAETINELVSEAIKNSSPDLPYTISSSEKNAITRIVSKLTEDEEFNSIEFTKQVCELVRICLEENPSPLREEKIIAISNIVEENDEMALENIIYAAREIMKAECTAKIKCLKAAANNRDLIKDDESFEYLIDAISKQGKGRSIFELFTSPSSVMPVFQNNGEYQTIGNGSISIEDLISWYDWKDIVCPFLESRKEINGNQDFAQDNMFNNIALAITKKGSNARNKNRKKPKRRKREPKPGKQ